jgi:hypothetical protein
MLTLAMLFHALPSVRQVDVQHMELAFRLLESMKHGGMLAFIFAPLKYPFLPIVIHAFLYAIIFFLLIGIGVIPSLSQEMLEAYIFTGPAAIHFVTRLTSVLMGVLLLVYLYRASKLLFPDRSSWGAVILMLSSMLFLTFVTAMRLHVPEVALTFITFFYSIKLSEEKTLHYELFAFGSAVLAFSILQNGLFAFIFPVTAHLIDQKKTQWRRLFSMRLIILIILSLFVSSLLGYPFLWKQLFMEHHIGFGLGNTDIQQAPWGIHGFRIALHAMMMNEFFPFIFACFTLILWKRGEIRLHPLFYAVALYIILYLIFFGSIAWTTQRYFLPFTPFLALLGGVGLMRHPRLFAVFCVFLAIVHLKFTSLALLPDSLDQAREFVQRETKGVVMLAIPHYEIGIPPTRSSIKTPRMERERFYLAQEADQAEARDLVTIEELSTAQTAVFLREDSNISLLDSSWKLCKDLSTAPYPEAMFLWSEVDWPFYRIFRTKALGPSLSIYCRNT